MSFLKPDISGLKKILQVAPPPEKGENLDHRQVLLLLRTA